MNTAHAEAAMMLKLFASVGVTSFVLPGPTRAGQKEGFRRNVNLAELRRALPAMLDAAPARQRKMIVRPHGPGVSYIQLDDLKEQQLDPLAPAVFLTLEPSPGNFQAWAAIAG